MKMVLIKIVLLMILNTSLAADFFEKPHINVDKEVIVEANENYTLICQGNKPIFWTTPLVTEEEQGSWTKFKTEENTPSNSNYKYEVSLHIFNMSYPFVGFYNCHFNNAQNNYSENEEISRVYLFVDDKNNLAVSDLGKPLIVYPGEEVNLDCRPTSKEVFVTLYSGNIDLEGQNGTEIKLDVFYGNVMFRYHPFYGIYTNYTFYPDSSATFKCQFNRDKVKDDKRILVICQQKASFINPPILMDQHQGHTVVGDTIKINCTVTNINDREIKYAWTILSQENRNLDNIILDQFILEIPNATIRDRGIYTCNVSDDQNNHNSSSINLNIFDKKYHKIEMEEILDDIEYQEMSTKTWKIKVWGHPSTNFTWLNNKQENIENQMGTKYEVFEIPSNEDFKYIITLKIKNVNVLDFGNYTLIGKNKYENKKKIVFLNVTGKPIVTVKANSFYLIGAPGKVKCIAGGRPTPQIIWKLKPCPGPECKTRDILGETVDHGINVTSEVEINPTDHGEITCIASNNYGFDNRSVNYLVTDVADGFAVTGLDETAIYDPKSNSEVFAKGYPVSISCTAASKYNTVNWLYNNETIQQNERITIFKKNSMFSKSQNLEIVNSKYSDSGIYTCKAVTSTGHQKEKHIVIKIKDHVPACIKDTNMNKDIQEDFPKAIDLKCIYVGIPKPLIRWYKNNAPFESNSPRIQFENDKQILKFNETKETDAGTYKCELYYENKLVDVREMTLTFRNAPISIQNWTIYIIILLVLLLLFLGIFLVLKINKERKFKREMRIMGLTNFEKGAVENINPELGIDDQAELLPYDKKWEFPIENLILGKQLGSGAFGVVLRAEAKKIVEYEPVTTVAVKMVKKNADNTYIKALASELKIMIHLGKHLNVVNLLGACTKNVAKKELMVIVEYCRFGNIQNYLLRHRGYFINQLDHQNDKINTSIGQDIINRSCSTSSKCPVQTPLMKCTSFGASEFGNKYIPFSQVSTSGSKAAFDDTTTSQGEYSSLLSNNSVQPEWRSNYKGDYKGHVNPITTTDLVAYAFQIARGMEYLVSRKVLHGDLAARNILLSDDNVVKICDFGLAKSMYKSDNYKKRGDCPLPVKWMAIESIRDRIFSTQSDVWSFGIVLWELFSLGRTPYPGMEADERLYHRLVEGYRLECPEYCPKQIYQLMTECWSVNPNDRPDFAKLSETIGSLLEDTIKEHYIDLNIPYLVLNSKMLGGNNDYLAMISPPTFETVSSPHYVNDMVTQQSQNHGYMSMSPNSIFSPRIQNDEIFNFAAPTTNNQTPKENIELQLIVPVISETDKETLCSSNSVSNPSYQFPLNIIDATNTDETSNSLKPSDRSTKSNDPALHYDQTDEKFSPSITMNDFDDMHNEIVKTADNYVNIHQNRNSMNKIAFGSRQDSKMLKCDA